MTRSKKGILISITILIYSLIYRNYIISNLSLYSNMINNGFIVLITFISYLLLGLQKNKSNKVESSIALYVIIFSFIYLLSLYVIGIYTGYRKNWAIFDIRVVINNAINIIVLYSTIEVLRYIFSKTNRDNKVLIILFNLSLTIFEIVITLNNLYYYDNSTLFNFIITILLPVTIKNFVLTYLSYNFNYKYCLIYSISSIIWIYISPVLPMFNIYLYSIIRIIIPTIMYIFIKKSLKTYNEGENIQFNKKASLIINPCLIIISFFIILLISGVTEFQIIAIASESMTPTIHKGDSVVINKNISIEQLKENDIIAYQDGEKIIVHRIIKVTDDELVTKGDYNNSEDDTFIDENNLVGKYLFKIPLIAYPALWLKDFFS